MTFLARSVQPQDVKQPVPGDAPKPTTRVHLGDHRHQRLRPSTMASFSRPVRWPSSTQESGISCVTALRLGLTTRPGYGPNEALGRQGHAQSGGGRHTSMPTQVGAPVVDWCASSMPLPARTGPLALLLLPTSMPFVGSATALALA